jgi:hypothetical protein
MGVFATPAKSPVNVKAKIQPKVEPAAESTPQNDRPSWLGMDKAGRGN